MFCNTDFVVFPLFCVCIPTLLLFFFSARHRKTDKIHCVEYFASLRVIHFRSVVILFISIFHCLFECFWVRFCFRRTVYTALPSSFVFSFGFWYSISRTMTTTSLFHAFHLFLLIIFPAIEQK